MSLSGFDDRNILGMFYEQYEARFAGSWALSLSMFNGASDRATEEYGILGANSAFREWLGPRQANVIRKDLFEIRNRTYEGTLDIPEDETKRDKTGMLAARIGEFTSDVAADHWEDLLVSLINANGLCYDGQNFFDTDHVWGDSGTIVNSAGATQVPSSNVSTTTAPTPTEAANVILEGTAHMMTFKNDKGRAVNGQMKQIEVVVATAPLYSACVQAVTGGLLTGNVDNPLTGMKQGGFQYSVKLIPELTSATAKIRLFRKDGVLKPFILQEERAPRTLYKGPDSEYFFDTRHTQLGVDASRGAGYGQFLHALEITLT
jgi:phage major head subunit gpT-like protein